MSYSVANNANFSLRMQKWMLAFQDLREEAARLDAIYTNETLSGAHGNWASTSIALTGELSDGVTMYRDLEKFMTNQSVDPLDREQVVSPFIQVD